MRGSLKTGMIAGLAAGSVSVDSAASAASGDRADKPSRIATLGCPLAGLPALPGAQRRGEAAE